MNATIKIQHIDKLTAQQWLENKWPEQRPIRATHVARLESDMRAGRFKLSPDAILRVQGKLANGQHRLMAVVQSGIKTPFLVMESQDDELYRVLDCGIKRTVSDGLIGVQFAAKMPSMARYILVYTNGLLTRGLSSVSVVSNRGASVDLFTTSSLIEFCESNREDMEQSLAFCSPLYSKRKIFALSMGAALHFIASQSGKGPEAESFLSSLYGGHDSSGDARINLAIARLEENSKSRAKLPNTYIFGLVIKAFVAVVKNQPLKVLRWCEGEEIPQI